MKTRHLFLGGLLLSPFLHAGIPGDVTLETAFPGASLSFPVALRHAGDGSGRVFIVERGTGQIRIINAGNLLAQHFLDISAETTTAMSGERGFLGLAFHPDYANNGLFYINHTADNMAGIPDGDTVIAEFQVSGDPNIADGGSRRNLLVIAQDFSNHNGGDLHFGPDGYLYIGMGDGGSGNDPCNRAQTLKPADIATSGSCRDDQTAALLGKMLRIDVNNTTPPGANDLCGAAPDGSAPYAVPADNPFVIFADRFEHGQAGRTGAVCAEVWAYGLRNPYRFSFDRDTGDLFIGDVGQNQWEEISFQPAASNGGRNYGWKICEAIYERGSATNLCTLADRTDPILWYPIADPLDECAVTGGFRYRGPVTSLQGTYVYGDYCSGQVWFAEETAPGQWTEESFDNAGFGITGFGEDQNGRLYLLRSNGEILRFAGDA